MRRRCIKLLMQINVCLRCKMYTAIGTCKYVRRIDERGMQCMLLKKYVCLNKVNILG